MAGNKVNAKAKGKEDRGKGNVKSIVPNNDETEDTDFSLLRKPIQTSITGFAQARKIFDMATEELKTLLSNECDLLYECKVCRNLFRSLANFISHKRVYCQDKFNSTIHGHFIKSSSTLNELTKIKHIEEGYQESLKEFNESESMETDEVDERIPLTKDLTMIIEKIAKNKGMCEQTDDEPQVILHKIPSTAHAVFQNVCTGEERDSDMRTQVNELDEILSRNIAVLQNDGKFKIESSAPHESNETPTGGVIQISDDEEGGNTVDLKCKKCDMQFSTQKTLRFHMKYKHVDTRVVYPCPDCVEIFSTSWSVFRHLFKVHRKSAAQIRRLRESIQAKAFKMNNPPAFYEKRKNNMKTPAAPKITEEERLEQENQAWMDNMEGDGEVPRCGGCGRAFERRAALAAHTHTCPPRSRALARRPPDAKRIEIQIRKDYNKGPATSIVLPIKNTDVNENKPTKENKEAKEVKEAKDVKEEEKPKVKVKKEIESEEIPEQSIKSNEDASSISVLRGSADERSSKSSSKSPEKAEDTIPTPQAQPAKPVRLPFAQHAEKSNLMALRQRIFPDIELETLQCKKCDARFDLIQDLYDHVAKHYNWMRYACKLCNFKHYNFDKLPEHVKIVHKLKGDKDFYFSTVKAIDGTEATELATLAEEPVGAEETSPDSRRPSRCSSDSSRLSDDSSSSSTRVEGSRKRKVTHRITSRELGKRRKSVKGTKGQNNEWADKADLSSNVKGFEENSSDIDEPYEKIAKKGIQENSSVASRRPVRRKTKPKNEDFEYDLSNLLKMEAQGYRDSQTVSTTTKSSQTKKKSQPDSLSNYEMLNKECCGALVSLSRKAVENARAHMKTAATLYIQKEKISSTIFVRPMIPRGQTRGEKLSPKKEIIEGMSNASNKEDTSTDLEKDDIETKTKDVNQDTTRKKQTCSSDRSVLSTEKSSEQIDVSNAAEKSQNDSNVKTNEKNKVKNVCIPSVVPLKFRRQSLDVIKSNPIINKNISEFTKAGMKTKILVIKPINRNKDGIQSVNTPLKFQTIKLKESNKSASGEDKPSDQVVVVKVPKVDCISRTVPENTKANACEKASANRTAVSDEPPKGDEETKCDVDPSKSIQISSNTDTNGDVIEKSEQLSIESTKEFDEKIQKSKEINDCSSTPNCDISERITEESDKNDSTKDKTETLNFDDCSEMACI